MSQRRIVRVSKKRTIYIPKEIADKVGISEGTYLELVVEDNKLVMIPIPDPFWLALKGPKFASMSVDEIEKISEEEQRAFMNEGSQDSS